MRHGIRFIFIVSVTVLLSACLFHRQMSWSMEVKMVNNAPCFIIPEDIKTRRHQMVNNGLMISRLINGSYETVWVAPIMARSNYFPVILDQCLVNVFDDWQEGQYAIDTGIWFDNEIEQRLYHAEFLLLRDPETQQLNLSERKMLR